MSCEFIIFGTREIWLSCRMTSIYCQIGLFCYCHLYFFTSKYIGKYRNYKLLSCLLMQQSPGIVCNCIHWLTCTTPKILLIYQFKSEIVHNTIYRFYVFANFCINNILFLYGNVFRHLFYRLFLLLHYQLPLP